MLSFHKFDYRSYFAIMFSLILYLFLMNVTVTQDLSRIKPQMVQKVLSSIGLSDTNADFAYVNCQGEGFNGRSEAPSHTEMLELFPVTTGSGFGSNPRFAENQITLPFAISHHPLTTESTNYDCLLCINIYGR